MNWLKRITFLIVMTMLLGCAAQPANLDPEGFASPEAVALSLSTVNPEDSLHLFEYDRNAPIDIQEEKRWQDENATWIDFTYASPNGGRVPARLVIPDGVGPFPGMILMHGGPGTLEDMVGFTRAFARYGAVSILVTSPYKRPGGWVPTPYMGNTWPLFTYRDVEIKIQLINDLQRAVDILVARPEVDPDRLGYFGVSWGGTMGGLLAGVEDRIKAYVLVVGDGGLVEHTADPGQDGLNIHFSEKWAGYMWPTEPLHFVGRAAPAALLFQNGIHDHYVPSHDALRFYTAASEPKSIIWYEEGHSLQWEFVYDSAEWLQPYLGEKLLFMGPDYRPSAKIFEWIIISTILLSIAVLIYENFKRVDMVWGERVFWFLVLMPFGVFTLLFYWLIRKFPSVAMASDRETTAWGKALPTSVMSILILTIGSFFWEKIDNVLPLADFRLSFLTLYITMMICGLTLSMLVKKYWRPSVNAVLLSLNLYWIVQMLFPMLINMYIDIPSWLHHTPTAIIGMALSMPLHAWLLNTGLENAALRRERHPRFSRRTQIIVSSTLLLTYLGVFGSFVFVVKEYASLTWWDAVLVIFGVVS